MFSPALLDRYLDFKQVTSVSDPSANEFSASNGLASYPLKITNVMTKWRLASLWNYDYLGNAIGTHDIFVAEQKNDPPTFFKTTLSTFIQQVRSNEEGIQYSHFSHHLNSSLVLDYEIPEYFSCWYKKLPKSEQKLILSWIYMGTRYSYSSLHVDVYGTSAWNGVIIGKKMWLFYPPDQRSVLYNGEVNPFKPDYKRYPAFQEARPLVCIQSANEIVYTPSGWWHCVMNLEPGFALTENFINAINFEQVKMDLVAMGASKAVNKLEALVKL
ncbi:MAG: cupin-like domain-containing protein [Cyclobacteriaceae bacterium]|nr:cupin-like domain-containing protein [Cyclobacteriaceae bacterium]